MISRDSVPLTWNAEALIVRMLSGIRLYCFQCVLIVPPLECRKCGHLSRSIFNIVTMKWNNYNE